MRRLRGLVRRIGLSQAPPAATPVPTPVPIPATRIAETTPVTARKDDWRDRRLSMILPSINTEHYFGGIHTAVDIYRSLSPYFPASRLILSDSAPRSEAVALFPDHTLVSCDENSSAERQIVPYNDRLERTVPVAAEELWFATAWWTAYAAQRLAAWQAQEFGARDRIVYLIQDFEPGFYPWSSQSALALSTYRPDRDIAVFNTSLLAGFFASQGFLFRDQVVFEPVLNSGLRTALERARASAEPRVRRMIVYARPSTPRNAFELLCEGLRTWGWQDPASRSWELVAPGELVSDIDLGPVSLRALGKLDLQAYAQLLATSAIGLSFMISPHPSYPPLEMAAFGMGVVTNTYANKNLAAFSANIHSVSVLSPDAIAAALTAESSDWETRGMHPVDLVPQDHPFLSGSGLIPIAARLNTLLQNRGATYDRNSDA